jgi:MoxR-like ATPase
MRILDLIKLAPDLYKAGSTVSLIGPPGCGKTQVAKNEITKVLSGIYGEEFGFHDSLAPTLDAPDYKGFLVPTKDADGTATSFFTRSPELPSKDYLARHPRGIYLVDELSSAEMLTQKALAPVLLEKRFGNGRFGLPAIECRTVLAWCGNLLTFAIALQRSRSRTMP